MTLKNALSIGINKYQISGNDLRGCVNDSNNISEILIGRGFEVTQLLNEKATAELLKAEIQRLIGAHNDACQYGRAVSMLHYSGHGSQIPDTNDDEIDGLDEILCPHDLDWDRRIISDDWLHAQIRQVDPRGQFVVLMDCCNSGTNTRALASIPLPDGDGYAVERYIASPRLVHAHETGTRSMWHWLKKLFRRDDPLHNTPEVVITGCRDDQTAADAFIDGIHQGALSWAFCQAMAENPGSLAFLHGRIQELLTGRFSQTPQLVGARERIGESVLA